MADKVEEAGPGKKKSILIWIMGGVLVLALAGGGGFAAFKYFRKGTAAKAGERSAEKDKEKEKKAKEAVHSTLNLDPFLVNLADKEEVRFVKATFRLGLEGEKEGEELGKNTVFLSAARDAIISLLTSRTSDQILTPEGKDTLRKDIQHKVNELMPKGKVQEVYIVDFVVQL